MANEPKCIGAWYDGFDVLPMGEDSAAATGAVPAVVQANGLVLPARASALRDPSMRADVRRAMRLRHWTAFRLWARIARYRLEYCWTRWRRRMAKAVK